MGRVITVRIINEEPMTAPNPDAVQPTALAPVPSAKKEKDSENGAKKRADITVNKILKDSLDNIADTSDYFIGKYFSQTENYHAQQSYANAKKTISMVKGLKQAIQTGAMTGSPVGMTVAVGTYVTGQLAGIYKEYEEAERALVEQAYSNYYYGRRAGLIDGGRGTEN